MNRFIENWCVGTGTGGTMLASVSIAEVKDIFSIVFLCIQLFILLLGITIKFFKFINDDGKIDKEEAEELFKDLDNIKDVIEKEKKDDNN